MQLTLVSLEGFVMGAMLIAFGELLYQAEASQRTTEQECMEQSVYRLLAHGWTVLFMLNPLLRAK